MSLVTLVILSSCKKEIIVEVEVPAKTSWSLDSALYGFNKIQLSSFPLNDSILAVANASVISYVNINRIGKPISGAYINLSPSFGNLLAPRLSESVGVTLLSPTQMKVFNPISPVSNSGSFIYTPSYLGSANSTKGFVLPAFPHAGYPVIKNKFILAPTEIDYPTRAYASLLSVGHPDAMSVSLAEAKPITLDPAPSTIGFSTGTYFSAAYFDKFFIYLAQQFYRVDTTGNVKAFGYSPQPGVQNGRVTQMFTLDNVLFASGTEKMFASLDHGETWSLFSDVMGTEYAGLTYFNLGSELYATYQSQLWRVTFSGSSFNYVELDNDGLQGNQITSMSKMSDYVFITTLSGLFYREYAKLNSPRG
jgi:hypothetical protein